MPLAGRRAGVSGPAKGSGVSSYDWQLSAHGLSDGAWICPRNAAPFNLARNRPPVLQLTGASHFPCLVVASTNRLNWTPQLTNTVNALGEFDFTDAAATNRPVIFYRVSAD